MGHMLRKALVNMFNIYHEDFSSTLRLLPGCIQRRGSLVYYSEDTFLSNRIPDSFQHKFEDDAENELYKTARKRTNTEHSEKILFQALNINPAEAQLMVKYLGFILQKC
jgi:hypothetical protein